jgi:hypothetical protein
MLHPSGGLDQEYGKEKDSWSAYHASPIPLLVTVPILATHLIQINDQSLKELVVTGTADEIIEHIVRVTRPRDSPRLCCGLRGLFFSDSSPVKVYHSYKLA